MRVKVHSSGDGLLIEVTGVAGRQMDVLRALHACRGRATVVSVRAGADAMRIHLREADGRPLEAARLYEGLRESLRGAAATA